MSARPIRPRCRRRVATGASVVAVALLLAGCAESRPEDGTADAQSTTAAPAAQAPGTASPSSSAGATQGPWSFTDDLGETVTLDARPQRVVAQVSAAATLLDYGITPIATFGPVRGKDGRAANQAAGLAERNLPSVGGEFGEFNVEQLATLNPDLIVTLTYEKSLAEARYDPYWYIPADSQRAISGMAPIVAIGLAGKPVEHTVERFAELAAALGAELGTGAYAQDRTRFTAARDELRAAVAAKPGLTALFVSGYAENLYVANPKVAVDVWWFRELGLDTPDVPVAEGEFWETLSWEQADRYKTDLILNDIRIQALTLDQMTSKYPTFANLPAVKAGQVGNWYFESPYSYRVLTEVVTDLTEEVRAADPDLV